MGFVASTRFCRESGFVANTRFFGFVLSRLLLRHKGFYSDFVQISAQKIGGWDLCVSPNQGNEGSSKSFHNPTNLKEVSNANNAKKENFAGSSMGEGSPGNSQMFNKENIGGKKSRIPDIR